MYINPKGELFSSFISDDGAQFAQIAGRQLGKEFHLVSVPPSGMNEFGTTVRDATASWENSPDQLKLSGEAVGHPYSYTLKRAKQR